MPESLPQKPPKSPFLCQKGTSLGDVSPLSRHPDARYDTYVVARVLLESNNTRVVRLAATQLG